jgi:hypothetical protein
MGTTILRGKVHVIKSFLNCRVAFHLVQRGISDDRAGWHLPTPRAGAPSRARARRMCLACVARGLASHMPSCPHQAGWHMARVSVCLGGATADPSHKAARVPFCGSPRGNACPEVPCPDWHVPGDAFISPSPPRVLWHRSWSYPAGTRRNRQCRHTAHMKSACANVEWAERDPHNPTYPHSLPASAHATETEHASPRAASARRVL